MSPIDYEEIDTATEKRFPGTSFNISCFDSVSGIDHKVVNISMKQSLSNISTDQNATKRLAFGFKI